MFSARQTLLTVSSAVVQTLAVLRVRMIAPCRLCCMKVKADLIVLALNLCDTGTLD
jgi:hypothetical protein